MVAPVFSPPLLPDESGFVIRPRACRFGFSLLELVLAIGVAGILAALIAPAAAGIASSANRRGAVENLMGTFEQARVAAIEGQQRVYIGFADGDFPVEDMRFAAWIVFREASESELAAQPAKRFVVLKPWTRLPKSIAFASTSASLAGAPPSTFPGLRFEVGAGHVDEEFPVVAFQPSGAVGSPAAPLRVLLYEGHFAGGRDNPLRSLAGGGAGRVEQISLSPFTGRAEFDVAQN